MKHDKIFPATEASLVGQPFSEILARLERAARNETRAHLEPSHVQALITSPVFMLLSQLKQEEIGELWQRRSEGSRVEPNSETIGYGIAPTGMTGPSVGWMEGPLAADLSASAAARRIIRQTPPKKR
jgi:hypothetical protein